jgi:hypothetical protein
MKKSLCVLVCLAAVGLGLGACSLNGLPLGRNVTPTRTLSPLLQTVQSFPSSPPSPMPRGVQNARFTLIEGPRGKLSECRNTYTVTVRDLEGVGPGSVAFRYIVYDDQAEFMLSGGGQTIQLTPANTYTVTLVIDTSALPGMNVVRYAFEFIDKAGNEEVSEWFQFEDGMECTH